MKFICIIPARYGSSRFPGKPLAVIKGKTVIQRVYEKASSVLEDVYVATDDERIFKEVENFGGNVIMTRSDHESGTDRIEEAVSKISVPCDVVINIQGDEPFIDPSQIQTLCNSFNDEQTQIATLGKPFSTTKDVLNPNSPKIVMDNNNYALYFSRNMIPFIKGVDINKLGEDTNITDTFPYLKHIGIYAYRRSVLSEITRLEPSSLEKTEGLEQLRWLQNGYKIKVGLTNIETIGIDTPEDLTKATLFLEQSL